MKKFSMYAVYNFFFSIILCSGWAGEKPFVEQIVIEVKKESREFAFTNKQTAFYYGETGSKNRSSWQGLNVMAREFLEDYLIFADTMPVTKNDIKSALVFPHQLKRFYKNGTTETITLLDSLPVLLVEINLPDSSHLKILPLFSDIKQLSDCEVDYKDSVLLIARKNHLKKTEKENYPVWLGVAINREALFINSEFNIDGDYSPSGLFSKDKQTQFIIAIGVGDTKEETVEIAKHAIVNSQHLIEKRANRMEKLLRDTEIRTGNKEFNRALMWAKLSMDALIMNQLTKGIFAGLPWFNNYWGRDSFISLLGAALVTGNYEEAKNILLSFAEYQEKNPQSSNFGRIPNIVTTTHKSYNTADGTPRFVISALDYYMYSGDKKFVKEIFPVIERSIEGTLKFHSDQDYFLVHEDAETWMDAVGPNGAWSPRGNRANDIQVLWYQQLRAGARFAEIFGKTHLYKKWKMIAEKLQKNFEKEFVSPEQNFIYDHIKMDGTKDKQIRPNQIFCAPILPEETRGKVLKNVVTNLTYVYGITSLYHYDKNFHPYHQYAPYYVKDAAYHNGIVWTWLSGAVISELCRFDKQEMAYRLTDNLTHQILERGAVGTLSELLDAVPRAGENEPRLSGTFSQAWSLAEYIRNVYQDYLGVKVENGKRRLINISPRVPKFLGNIDAKIKLGMESFNFSVKDSTQFRFSADNLTTPSDFEIQMNTSKNELVTVKATLSPQEELIVYVDALGNVHAFPEKAKLLKTNKVSYENIFKDMDFATPVILSDYPVFHKQKHPLLNNSVIKQQNPDAKLICDVSDPEGDDKGDGNYVYPLNTNFVDGILDILNFKVRYDDEHVYFELKFRKLVNPGWHPEYGFQLTYAAIIIDQDGIKNSGRFDVGMNSKYNVGSDEAFEKIIYVGGGVRVDDLDRTVLVEYIPMEEDVTNSLGDISTAVISFAIPQKYLGVPNDKWKFTILVGGQDDHGGAGLGEFRNVEFHTTDWTGGGKKNTNSTNVFDVLIVR
jgi:glycogen debranching enzyme